MRLGSSAVSALMCVPETAMHEDDSSSCRKGHVGRARKAMRMQDVVLSIAIATGREEAPHEQLGAGVLTPDTAH